MELLNYKTDHKDMYQSNMIELEVLQDCLNVHLGKVLLEIVKNDTNQCEEKDVIKPTLPKAN